ncbi:HypC/HybG/HupF family hydrogenase formation chaperone [Ectothiorhodospira mobilis]|uniref:HypC/HybG/HupF family hydrogenase formation chaperone n=1 Tax=Ectothiorhodospira mobilis TaxID=195064 RepID=UPI001EE93336|nr:HypC/HybG/HupF family hydrogenase formation chaperone [Ectothiorhodospira mobilis]MCG5535124.1 HypC/HybG/HupF family hydrogenase formation chaperone [Ectothiorhodospira mobilis]
MCLAVPAEVKERLPGDRARVDLGGVCKTVSTVLLEQVAVGDFVLVHVGFAISRLDPEEARRTLETIRALGEMGDGGPPPTCDPPHG